MILIDFHDPHLSAYSFFQLEKILKFGFEVAYLVGKAGFAIVNTAT